MRGKGRIRDAYAAREFAEISRIFPTPECFDEDIIIIIWRENGRQRNNLPTYQLDSRISKRKVITIAEGII